MLLQSGYISDRIGASSEFESTISFPELFICGMDFVSVGLPLEVAEVISGFRRFPFKFTHVSVSLAAREEALNNPDAETGF